MSQSKTVFFDNHQRQLKIPFIIYVHFEALQIPTTKPRIKIVHKPCGFSYSIKCSYDDSLSKYEQFFGEFSTKVLWEKLELECKTITRRLISRAEPQDRKLNEAELKSFRSIVSQIMNCHWCGEQLEEDDKEVDFFNLTGQFLGAAHKKCKFQPKVPHFVPVVMHNLSKYGAHFLLNHLTNDEMKEISFVGNDKLAKLGFVRKFPNCFPLRFIDSRRFMDVQIEDLENILEDSKKHKIKEEFRGKKEFDLMKKRTCFPFYYMDSFKKFSDGCLPFRNGFFDQIRREDVGDEEYERSLKIWETFKCRSMGDYFKVYLKSNVLLLEDVFESFRSLCLKKYHLDPGYYFTAAGFAWDAMLKFTKVKLELLEDETMIDFLKSNLRGGITHCSKRYAKANNVYCEYDRRKESSFIVHLDVNNLGGWSMCQKLPFTGFRWLNQTEIRRIQKEIKNLDDNDFGYVFEVDLDYPRSLHKLHNDLPFCFQHLTIPPPPIAPHLTSYKAVLNFYNKKNYVLDYRNLQQCLQHGLILKKIHRVLKYRHCKWLEPYVSYNTKLRTQTTCNFEIKLYKFLNNAVYGKMTEKFSSDRPIYAGFTVLELSKNFVYDFHYQKMLARYRNKINLLYIDTDGLIYEIQTSDFYRDVKQDPNFLSWFDTSGVDKRWGLPVINKKVLGKMKDEFGGKIIREFVGVGAKVYCVDVEGEVVKKVSMKKIVSIEDYKNCVIYDEYVKKKCWTTEVVGHEIYTSVGVKVLLSPGDKQRFVLSDKINTIAWGFGNY